MPEKPQIERKLAAIMFTDIAGYTESMSKSESKTLNLLEKKSSILKPLLKEYKGTFVKEIGDGTLSYFESAVNAATCAVKLQETTYDDKDMNIRVGIHIGDIVFKDGDVFGGGVNVASRLESIAPAGGVCVSKSVYDELSNQDDFDGIELGLQSLKGVGRLVEVFGLKGDKLNEPNPKEYQKNIIDKHSDDELPSIAIIPFDNKGEEEDTFYAYGISAELKSACSSAGLIRVASKKQVEDASELSSDELSKKLNIRYISTGELWRIGGVFQLSIELYDTKEKKVIWSDIWQEKWDNLTTIKENLTDGLLKALNIKPQKTLKVKSTITEAYEYYLKAKYRHKKTQNLEDTEIARGLLEKTIELDDNLILAKTLLGWTFYCTGDYDKAMKLYTSALKQSEEFDDKSAMIIAIRKMGNIYGIRGDHKKAFDCNIRSLKICEEIGDKRGMGRALSNIGNHYRDLGDYDKSIDYFNRSLYINEEIDDEFGIAVVFGNIGAYYLNIGENIKALEYSTRCLTIHKGMDDKKGMTFPLRYIGIVHFNKGDYKKAEEYLKKSLAIQREIGFKQIEKYTITYLYLTFKYLGKEYDVEEIRSLSTKHSEFNYRQFQLLEDTSYLKTAYNQVKEKADNLAPDVKAKFLSYPIPKAIVEEWETK